jgi:MFS family permease
MLKLSQWRVLWRREIVVIGLFLFITDMVIGAMASTMSLFAQGLGASLTLIGLLVATLGLARFTVGIVIGEISDRRGRKSLLVLGMAMMGGAALFYAGASQPLWLLPVNVLFGVGFVTCLTIGLAYVGDMTTTNERSLAYGTVSTAMGSGFAVGALIGGVVAARLGFSTLYLGAAAAAAIGCLVVWRGLANETRPAAGIRSASLRRQIGLLMTNSIILVACIGSLLSNLVFGGLILTFFPIYAAGLGMTLAVIGSMLATRTLASTLARVPGGMLGNKVPGHYVMLGTLTIAAVVAVALVQVTSSSLLTLLLIAEGVAYGLFLATAQASVATQGAARRGVALGAFMAAASVGDSFIPLFLGPVADLLGIKSVFYLVGGITVFGIGLIIRVLTQRRQTGLPDSTI